MVAIDRKVVEALQSLGAELDQVIAVMVMVRWFMRFMVLIMLMALVLFTVLIVMSNLCEKEVISSHIDFLWCSSLIFASLRWFSHPG